MIAVKKFKLASLFCMKCQATSHIQLQTKQLSQNIPFHTLPSTTVKQNENHHHLNLLRTFSTAGITRNPSTQLNALQFQSRFQQKILCRKQSTDTHGVNDEKTNGSSKNDEGQKKKGRFANFTGKNSWKGGVLFLGVWMSTTAALVVQLYGKDSVHFLVLICKNVTASHCIVYVCVAVGPIPKSGGNFIELSTSSWVVSFTRSYVLPVSLGFSRCTGTRWGWPSSKLSVVALLSEFALHEKYGRFLFECQLNNMNKMFGLFFNTTHHVLRSTVQTVWARCSNPWCAFKDLYTHVHVQILGYLNQYSRLNQQPK